MTVVVFNYDHWLARYPEFAAIGPVQAQAFFNDVAALYLNNTDASPVSNIPQRTSLLNMATAHLAALSQSSLVGRINSAGEGSVNVGTEYAPLTQSMAWWVQTKYGAAYWQATSQFRKFRYRPSPAYCAPRRLW